jgi:hypothetical protein
MTTEWKVTTTFIQSNDYHIIDLIGIIKSSDYLPNIHHEILRK